MFFLALAVAVSSFMGQPTNLVIGDKIGIVEIYGVISDSKQVIEQLHDFRDNDSIKALVLRVDSPGGGVGPSQEIYDEILALDELKPVVVSMGSVAASAREPAAGVPSRAASRESDSDGLISDGLSQEMSGDDR